MALGEGVERVREVRRVLLVVLLEGALLGPGAVGLQRGHRALVIVLEDAARRVEGHVDAAAGAAVGAVERADDVGADGLLLVVLAPVHVRAARHARRAEHVRRLLAVELRLEGLAVLQAHLAHHEVLALLREHGDEHAAEPARAAEEEELLGRRVAIGAVGAVGARHLRRRLRHGCNKSSRRSKGFDVRGELSGEGARGAGVTPPATSSRRAPPRPRKHLTTALSKECTRAARSAPQRPNPEPKPVELFYSYINLFP
mmetsp:Transcript_45931/g.143731  ORF Transcript_45931/g.143731 Transcript_45931/m.143731 type:complete len:257 (-) Transcript_45931:406-1176(-)